MTSYYLDPIAFVDGVGDDEVVADSRYAGFLNPEDRALAGMHMVAAERSAQERTMTSDELAEFDASLAREVATHIAWAIKADLIETHRGVNAARAFYRQPRRALLDGVVSSERRFDELSALMTAVPSTRRDLATPVDPTAHVAKAVAIGIEKAKKMPTAQRSAFLNRLVSEFGLTIGNVNAPVNRDPARNVHLDAVMPVMSVASGKPKKTSARRKPRGK